MGFHPIARLKKMLFGTQYVWLRGKRGKILFRRVENTPFGRRVPTDCRGWFVELLPGGATTGDIDFQEWRPALLDLEEAQAEAVIDGLSAPPAVSNHDHSAAFMNFRP